MGFLVQEFTGEELMLQDFLGLCHQLALSERRSSGFEMCE